MTDTNSKRKPALDDEADSLDCFATESVSEIHEADDAALAEFEEVLPSVRVASLPADPARRLKREAVVVPPPEELPSKRISLATGWQLSWPGSRVAAVALLLLSVGVIGILQRGRSTTTVTVTPEKSRAPVASVAPTPRTTESARVVPAVPVPTPSRETAAAPGKRTATAVPAPSPRAAVAPTVSTETPASPEVRSAPREETPAVTADRVVIADPEVVRAEPEAAPVRAVVTPPTDRASIESLLQQYRDAYDRLDAPAAAIIWPRVDTRALNRAFSTLAEQDVSFERCDLDIAGTKANAKCTGEIRYVRRVGDQNPRVRRLSWSFALERVSDRWRIAQVSAN